MVYLKDSRNAKKASYIKEKGFWDLHYTIQYLINPPKAQLHSHYEVTQKTKLFFSALYVCHLPFFPR